ncbi:hypothetical protein [Pedobacter sp. V48]|uniref:hypothetical protein n=1 Tax=Pedobacter sp. V48 TaxID=509635 RepID=UPI0003E59B27|nr:hypothetical protein [Pedobacter sp. V48]ETZ24362.1 hypothetical protein N824_12655 [Pedobacter sp. V48]
MTCNAKILKGTLSTVADSILKDIEGETVLTAILIKLLNPDSDNQSNDDLL